MMIVLLMLCMMRDIKKPVITLTLNDKQELMNVISTYHTLIKVKAQIDQFVKGLESIKIHSYMVKFLNL